MHSAGPCSREDGTTATLDTPEMVQALTFLKDLKWTEGVMPARGGLHRRRRHVQERRTRCAPAAAASLAPSATPPPTGMAAVDHQWRLDRLATTSKLFGDKLNICPIPQVTGADWPTPFLAGAYLMLSKALANDAAKQAAVLDFANFVDRQRPSSWTWSRR